ncbi:cupin domain-containing protein [Amaricoccus sp.]|uniref:cupin domain-containing protein n=1 Tax=Amaricoccus sp. TaxID=1872485 RepID=UPI00260F9324|nr:cupin domain-containing protein [uncultured Amaricoccus sp.]
MESDITHPLEHVLLVSRIHAPEAADAPSDRLREGSGEARVWNCFSDPAGRFHVGHWQAEPGVIAVDYSETELCVLIEGNARLTDETGSVTFGPGEAFLIKPGFRGTWESIGRVTKIYAILDAD